MHDMYFELMRMNEVERYMNRTDSIIVDLRTQEDYWNGHICGAVNIPYERGDDIGQYVQEYSFILLYCHSGSLSLMAARSMHSVPGRVFNLCGGLRAYRGKLVRER